MIKRALVVVLVASTASISNVCAENVPPLSRVRVQVTDGYGHSLREARISVNGPGIAIDATGRDVLELKWGTYTFVVDVSGFSTFRSSFKIDQPEQIVSVAMRLGSYEGLQVPCSIKGRVNPVFDNIRVRLMSIYGMEVRDAPVKGGGVFQFDGLECGAYMLLVTHDGECVGLAFPVATIQGKDVRIPLQRGPGALCSAPVIPRTSDHGPVGPR